MRMPFLALLLPLVLGAQTPEAPKLETAPQVEAPAPVVEAPAPVVEAPAVMPAQPGPEAAQGSILLIYRQKRMAGAILNTSVFVDGLEIADMDNGTYLKVKVTPGEHTIHADEKKDAMVLPIEPGKTYYFRMALRAGLWKGHGKLEPVDEVTGLKEFTEWKAKLVYAKDIRKPEMVVLD
jgi:hypothetical protein